MSGLNTKVGNYRWRVVALLFFATTINYIDRQILGMLKPFMVQIWIFQKPTMGISYRLFRQLMQLVCCLWGLSLISLARR